MSPTEHAIEDLARISWARMRHAPDWRDLTAQAFGWYRLALWMNDEAAADTAELLYRLAAERGSACHD